MANRKGKVVLTERQKTIKKVKQKAQKQTKTKQKKQTNKTVTTQKKVTPTQKKTNKSATPSKVNLPKVTTQTTTPKTSFKPTVTNTSKQYSSFKKSSFYDKKKEKKYDSLSDAQRAYNKGKNVTYLGTKQKTTTTEIGKKKHGGAKEKLTSVNALTKGEFNRMTYASSLNNKKQGNALLKGGKRTGQKDIREKVGSKTADSAYKSKAATGFMQGMSKADIFSNSVGTYNKSAKKAIKKTKDSTAYNVGYGVGMAADMGIGGIGSRGASAAELSGKAAKKVAEKFGKKAVEKSTKSAVKTFAKNRAGELIAETPSNILDAAKMSMDENGKVDKKELAKWAAINSGLTVGVGGALEGIGAAVTKKQTKRVAELFEKRNSGKATKEEKAELEKLTSKINKKSGKEYDTASSVMASNTKKEMDDFVENAKDLRLDKKLEKSVKVGKERREELKQKRREQVQQAVDEYDTQKKKASYENNSRKIKELETKKEEAKTKARNASNESTVNYHVAEVNKLDDQINTLKAENDSVSEDIKLSSLNDERDRLITAAKESGDEKEVETLVNAIDDVDNTIEGVKKEAEIKTASVTEPNNVAKMLNEGNPEEQIKATLTSKGIASKDADNIIDTAKAINKSATENQPVSATKVADDTVTPNGEKNLSKQAETPQKATTETDVPKNNIIRSATQDLNPEYSKMTDDELREAIKEETKQGKGKWKHGANINAKAGPGGHTLPEGKKLQYEASQHFAKAKAMEKELAERNLSDGEIAYRETEQLRNELDDVNVSISQNEAVVNDVGDSGFFFTAEEKAQAKKELEELKAKKTEIESKIKYANAEKEVDEAVGKKYSAVKDDDVIIKNEVDKVKAKNQPPKRKGVEKMSDDMKAVAKESNTAVRKIQRGFFNSFADWDSFVSKIDNPVLRKKGYALVQNVRMSRTKAVAKVYDQFTSIYKEAGLTKRGAKKTAEDFERYTYLMHDLERIDHDTEFLGKTEDEIRAQISELLTRHNAVTKDGQIIEDAPIIQFQQKIVKYFDELLDDDVKCGFDTADGVKALRSKYNNYVPTYRDWDEMGSYSASNDIHFANKFEAKGGTEQPLKSLYDQAIEKTKLTTRRTELNNLVDFVAEVNGVAKKDLPKGYEPDELMRASTLAYKDSKGHYITYWKDGKEQTLQISEGMYKGIRQWSGQDKLFFMEWKALNNKYVEGINRFFKNWITDYSLVFGVRNFVRDIETGFFYSPNGISYARNIPRAVACVLADIKPVKAFINAVGSENAKAYIDTASQLTQAYKKNGGSFSQLVTSTNPEKLIKLNNGKNPLNVIREINSAFETVPRMAEFCSVAEKRAKEIAGGDWDKLSRNERRKAMAKALDETDTINEAMYRAKEATLNFDRSGYIGRWLNSGFVPFFNPSVQGLSKLGRVLSKKGKTSGEFASMLAKFAVMGVGAEALVQAWWGDSEEYKDISDYNKTAYLCIPTEWLTGDKSSFIKIPKAREVSALQGPVTWGFQHMLYHCGGKDERLFSSFKTNAKSWWEQIGPVNPLSDNIFFSPVRIARNKTWYGGFIENFDDEDMVKAGKSYKAKDENTSIVAYGISKGLNEGADKICKMLGMDSAQTKNIKSKVWSPKKWDNLMDSYLGVIYDMTIKQTSQKNHKVTDIVDSAKSGEIGGTLSNTLKLLGSNWGNAFYLDTVVSNRHKQDMYQLKSDIKEEMQKAIPDIETDGKKMMDVRDEVIDKYGYNSTEYKTFKKKYAELTRLNNSFAYTSTSYDEMLSTIYTNDKLSTKQKDYWARQIKIQQNGLLNGRQNGDGIANADPMKWAYTTRKKNGTRLFSNEDVIRMCTYTDDEGNNRYMEAFKSYKKSNGNMSKFMNTTLGMRDVSRKCGDSLSWLSYTIGNYVIADKELKTGKSFRDVAGAYGMTDSDTDYIGQAKKYFTVGKGTLKTFTVSHKAIVQGAMDLCKYEGEMDSWDKVNILAKQMTSGKNGKKRKYIDRAYYAEGYYVLQTMNYGRCLFSDKYKDSKWTPAKISEFCAKNGFTYKEKDANGNTIKPNAEKVAKAIQKEYGDKYSREECAAIFGEICPRESNPFGSVGDYSEKGDTGIEYDGYGGYGRRGHRGGGGSGSGGSAKKGASTTYKATKLKDHTFKSNLDDAYRKKLKKLREKTR